MKPWILLAAAAVAAMSPAPPVAAQQRREGRAVAPPTRGPAAPVYLDRHRHDRYGPRHGWHAPVGPAGSAGLGRHGGRHYPHGAVRFRPYGPRFVLVAPPIGLVVALPPTDATWWTVPYHDASGVHDAAALRGDAAAPPDPVYDPRNGQSIAQTEADRQDCNRRATQEPRALGDAQTFQRSVASCMEARGFSVH